MGTEPLPSINPPSEMFDANEAERWQALRGPLETCRRVLTERYWRADESAVRHQRQHCILTVIAAVCGMAAVLFAIVQLSYSVQFPWLPVAEVIAALAAATAVGLGAFAARRRRWLLQRHQAERCRMLKFRFLIDPNLWIDQATEVSRTAWLEREAEAIDAMRVDSLDQWVEDDEIPDPPYSVICERVPPEIRGPLIEYYREVRLSAQINYFARRADENVRRDRPLRHLPAVFFFASVLAALGHFLADLVFGKERAHDVSVALIVLAAAFPVVGAMIRTIRLANEYERNTMRFRAKLIVLRRLSETLAVESDPVDAFRELWCAEQVLESEHREWLRLMLSAEWFG